MRSINDGGGLLMVALYGNTIRMRCIVLCFGAVLGCSGFGSAPSDPSGSGGDTPGDGGNNAPVVTGVAGDGVYVSASLGSDDGNGSQAQPLKSLSKAIEVASEKNLSVNACADTYPETVTVADGVSMYGYFDCSRMPWSRGTERARIVSPKSPAIVAHSLKLTTRIEGFEAQAPDFDGQPATDTDGSSIGLDVRDALDLTISDALIHAGKAAGGGDGTAASTNSASFVSPLASSNETTTSCGQPDNCVAKVYPGPRGGTVTCAIGPNGGAGGQAGDPLVYANTQPSTGAHDVRGKPLVATIDTAAGGMASGGQGYPGANGAAGMEGTDGSNGTWKLTADGFTRGNGGLGGSGAAGQGGGGGGSANTWFDGTTGAATSSPPASQPYWVCARGGGGGAGGCPGQSGTPGTGGAASIGALVIASGVTFESATIESSAGGRAGKGYLGSLATAGQLANSNDIIINGITIAGKGGDGGSGGNGGASGHGAPGPSFALAYFGPRPTQTATNLMPGPAGEGQPELRQQSSVGDKVLPAVVGVSEAEYQIQ